MSLLIVGLSHESADVDLLEEINRQPDVSARISAGVLASPDVSESLVLTTCNRVEVLAEVDRFHGAVGDIAAALASATSVPLHDMHSHLYVHYDDRAVHHLFSLACGLRSMALGEPQVLGQLRQALVQGQAAGTVGSHINPLVQRALRVGKRAHAETDLDSVAKSLVHLGVAQLAPGMPAMPDLTALVVGAGAMSALSVATLSRTGIRDLRVIARDPAKASALAARYGGTSYPWSELTVQLARVDLVVTCTGATAPVITAQSLHSARATQPTSTLPPLAILDLALPCDVEPAAAHLPGVTRCALAQLHDRHHDTPDLAADPIVREVQDMITGEVAAYLMSRRAESVAPTVAALRARAGAVVQAEMERLTGRLPDLDPAATAQVQQSLTRVVDKLLHAPTVRVKELHEQAPPEDYARVLRELFDLDARDAVAVETPPTSGPKGIR